MSGIVLQRPEFLVLLDALKAQSVIGLPRATLFPDNVQDFKALVQQGIEMLKSRQLLRVSNNVNILNGELLAMAAIVTRPQLAIITTRDDLTTGQQLFLHYVVNKQVVEHTLPDEQTHRLATLSLAELGERLQAVLAVPERTSPPAAFALPQEVLIDAQGRAEAGLTAAAQKALKGAGVKENEARLLVESLQAPQLNCVMSLLKYKNNVIADTRTTVITQGAGATWLITQRPAEAGQVHLATAQTETVADQVRQWLDELAPAPVPA